MERSFQTVYSSLLIWQMRRAEQLAFLTHIVYQLHLDLALCAGERSSVSVISLMSGVDGMWYGLSGFPSAVYRGDRSFPFGCS